MNYVHPVTGKAKAKVEIQPSSNVAVLEENSPIAQVTDTEQKTVGVSPLSKEDVVHNGGNWNTG